MAASMSSFYVPTDARETRDILENFGKVCAKRPIDMEAVSKAREEVIALGGENLLVEASTAVGTFAGATRQVDCTGRKLDYRMVVVLSGMKKIVKTILWFGGSEVHIGILRSVLTRLRNIVKSILWFKAS